MARVCGGGTALAREGRLRIRIIQVLLGDALPLAGRAETGNETSLTPERELWVKSAFT
jgi:hypothetical protein